MTYSIKQAFKQFFRNGAMSAASVFSITAMMLILGLFFLLVVNVSNIAEGVKQDFDTIQIYLLDSVAPDAAQGMMRGLEGMPEVKSARFLSREEAMEDFKARFGDKAYLLDLHQENPLPNSIIVKVGKIEDADMVAARARSLQGVDGIDYYKETVDRLIRLTDFVQIGALAVIGFLVVVSIVVVSNTIRLTVLAREGEISIMKYVGATNWFIRGPFLVEGMLIGLVSALVSACVVAFIYSKVTELFGMDLLVMLSTGLVSQGFMISNLSVIFAALGISIGACGSIISMRRFLDT
ncbi:MAG: permease-like cell division protein FtsX [Clostridiales Family XIII bacterium]|jgi:cell division transport system permease protein|nr:permease-like cell division protein FtsX [Clostridiales Family XIII bacterium]